MPDSIENPSMTLMMGEMRGQLRELIHTVNNLSQKFEGVARSVDSSAHIPNDITDLKARITAVELRVTALETERYRRDGAVGFGGWLARAIPWASVAAVVAAVYALIERKHP